MKKWNLLLVLVLALGMTFAIVGCDDDDDDDDNTTGPSEPTMEEMMVGTWESTGDLVAPLLVALYSTDTVQVTFTETVVTTREHRAGETNAWVADQVGTFTLGTDVQDDIYGITIDYTEAVAFQQQGIIKVKDATVDTLWLEVVIPNLATPPTPADGFGTTVDGTNIQTYVRVQ